MTNSRMHRLEGKGHFDYRKFEAIFQSFQYVNHKKYIFKFCISKTYM